MVQGRRVRVITLLIAFRANWVFQNYRVGGYRLYKIETVMKDATEPYVVYRRYKDVDWLFQILQCKYPACIIPPIPPKAALGNWYGDESE